MTDKVVIKSLHSLEVHATKDRNDLVRQNIETFLSVIVLQQLEAIKHIWTGRLKKEYIANRKTQIVFREVMDKGSQMQTETGSKNRPTSKKTIRHRTVSNRGAPRVRLIIITHLYSNWCTHTYIIKQIRHRHALARTSSVLWIELFVSHFISSPS